MSQHTLQRPHLSIGWDVGAWHCDHNAKSRDAIVILGKDKKEIGSWRGNLKEAIEKSRDSSCWLKNILRLCCVPRCCVLLENDNFSVTMAIDAPLGFPTAVRELISGQVIKQVGGNFRQNGYLFRTTERILADRDHRPLSAIQDMIGSQTTKAMHAVAKFAPIRASCGVWTNRSQLTVIETYPAAWKKIADSPDLKTESFGHEDINDAFICAEVAWTFANEKWKLDPPSRDIPWEEGWIWLQKSGVN